MEITDRTLEYLLKVVVIGSSKVGKSALLLRYCDDKFSEDIASTIGVDFRLKNLVVGGGTMAKIQIWDTAGQERFRNIVSLFYRGAEGLIIVFDVTDAESFKMVPVWLTEAADHIQTESQALADKHGIKYMETSAKTSSNVQTVFDSLAETILTKKIQSGHTYLASSSVEDSFIIQSKDLTQPGWCYWLGASSCSSE